MLSSLPYIRLPKRLPLGPMTPALRALADELRRDVALLATDIGDRNTARPRALALAADFGEAALKKAGLGVERQTFVAGGVPCHNLIAELPGTRHPDRVVVVGAHYDSVRGCPAANDNATGVASTLAIARRLAARPQPCTVRFVLFANEEPPYFHTEEMGSLVYARACRARGDDVRAMYTLETIGCYSDEPGSQRWPAHPLTRILPTVGDFILLTADTSCKRLVRTAADAFAARTPFPMLAAALPAAAGDIGWSDHWSFAQCGYPGLLVTDTAPFRYPHYHTPQDTPDKIDFDATARVVDGFEAATVALAETC
jgi:Zn-dependent M28 family amino/carboxypeptidase